MVIRGIGVCSIIFLLVMLIGSICGAEEGITLENIDKMIENVAIISNNRETYLTISDLVVYKKVLQLEARIEKLEEKEEIERTKKVTPGWKLMEDRGIK